MSLGAAVGATEESVLIIHPTQIDDLDSFVSHVCVQDESCENWAPAEEWEMRLLRNYLLQPNKRWVLVSGQRVGSDETGFYIHQNHQKRYFGIPRKHASVAMRASAAEALPVFLHNASEGALLEKVMRGLPALSFDRRKQVLMAAFKHADTNKNGFLSGAELGSMFRRIIPYMRQTDIDLMLLRIDRNGDGKVDYSEFADWVLSSAPPSDVRAAVKRSLRCEEDVVKAMFRIWDRNGDGLIAKKELARVMEDIWRADQSSKRQIKALIEQLDADGNGSLDYSEFIQFLFKDAPKPREG